MAIDMQTLSDALIALIVTVGIALVLSAAVFGAGAFHERGKARAARTAALRTQQEQGADTRELALR
jgi:hypothetical protein